MSREIRRVPAGWEHPRYADGQPRRGSIHQPQFEETMTQRAADDPAPEFLLN